MGSKVNADNTVPLQDTSGTLPNHATDWPTERNKSYRNRSNWSTQSSRLHPSGKDQDYILVNTIDHILDKTIKTTDPSNRSSTRQVMSCSNTSNLRCDQRTRSCSTETDQHKVTKGNWQHPTFTNHATDWSTRSIKLHYEYSISCKLVNRS